MGVIYILTNQSFPNYVKIGYADDIKQRLNQLNRTECTPFAFRLYAYYKVNVRLTDMKLHHIIDKLNPSLRSIDTVNGKKRVREFYLMKPEDAYQLFESIAEINGLSQNLYLVKDNNMESSNEFNSKINNDKSEELNVSQNLEEKVKKDIQENERKEENQIQINNKKFENKQNPLIRSRFSFEELSIPVGEKLCFIKDNSITCEVFDATKVKYNNKITTLSAITQELLSLSGKKGSYNGARYFTYKGKTIWDIRQELENKFKN